MLDRSRLTDYDGLFLEATKENENCTTEYSCSGCSKINICKQTKTGYQKLITLTCKAPRPYCDYATTSCISLAPLPCLPSDNFTCMEDGIFPDKTNCSRYHHCKDSISFPYTCAKGVFFDAVKGECTPTPCLSFDCNGKHGLKTFHKGNRNYFAYCGDNFPVIVSRCAKGYELNDVLQKCVPVCRVEGHMVDVEDCTKYYKCNTGGVVTHHDCPFTYGFDPVNFRCVPMAMLPFCKMMDV